jgi:hypothetical protein
MSSFRQFEANRRNALRSTGPKTDEGKRRSRSNAIRHGLTAETVVVNLEDAEDYKAFEATIIADYCAETAVARELVLRLASLLWRLRRATAIETDLFARESDLLDEHEADRAGVANENSGQVVPRPLARFQPNLLEVNTSRDAAPENNHRNPPRTDRFEDVDAEAARRTSELSGAFLRLAKLDGGVFERLNRYESAVWRQAVQIIWTLNPIRVR